MKIRSFIGIATLLVLTSASLLAGPRGFEKRETIVTTTTIDNATNSISTFIPTPGTVVRIELTATVNALPGNQNACFGRIALFKCDTNGLVTKIGPTASLAVLKEDSSSDLFVDTNGVGIEVKIVGIDTRVMHWTAWITYYVGD